MVVPDKKLTPRKTYYVSVKQAYEKYCKSIPGNTKCYFAKNGCIIMNHLVFDYGMTWDFHSSFAYFGLAESSCLMVSKAQSFYSYRLKSCS